MNALEIREQLAGLETDAAALEAETASLLEARNRVLTADPFTPLRQGEISAIDRELTRIAKEAAAKTARAEALQAQLPSEEDVQAARERASLLLERAIEMRRTFDDRAEAVVQECIEACVAVKAMCEARGGYEDLRRNLTDLRGDFGISIAVPQAAAVADAKIVQLTGLLLMQAAEGSPERQLLAEISSYLNT